MKVFGNNCRNNDGLKRGIKQKVFSFCKEKKRKKVNQITSLHNTEGHVVDWETRPHDTLSNISQNSSR